MGNHRVNIFLVALVIVVALPSANVVVASQDLGTQVRVCVHKETKVIKYFKNGAACPKNSVPLALGQVGPRGEAGYSGTSPSPWAQYRNCSQKLSAALGAGIRMSLKGDRDYFEASTGCVVERIVDEGIVGVASNAGIPVIKSWALVDSGSWTRDGFGMWGVSAISGSLTYRVNIANHDALSAGRTNGTAYRYCLHTGFAMADRPMFEHVEGDVYEITIPNANFDIYSGFSPINLGLGANYAGPSGCNSIGFPEFWPTIFEDPAVIGTDTVTRNWGW